MAIVNITRVGTNTFETDETVGLNYIHQATVLLTDAQIKALPTTPVTIVAAPGANYLAILNTLMLHAVVLDTSTGLFVAA